MMSMETGLREMKNVQGFCQWPCVNQSNQVESQPSKFEEKSKVVRFDWVSQLRKE